MSYQISHLCGSYTQTRYMRKYSSVTMTRKVHLARSSGQLEHWICFILPARGFGHLTMTLIPSNKSQNSLVLYYVRIGLFTVWVRNPWITTIILKAGRRSNLLVRVSCNGTDLLYCFNQGNSFSSAGWTKHKIRRRTRGTGHYLLHRLFLLTV